MLQAGQAFLRCHCRALRAQLQPRPLRAQPYDSSIRVIQSQLPVAVGKLQQGSVAQLSLHFSSQPRRCPLAGAISKRSSASTGWVCSPLACLQGLAEIKWL